MIPERRSKATGWLAAALAGWIVILMATLLVRDPRAEVWVLAAYPPMLFCYFAGLYHLVKARGRSGAWAALGLLGAVGWFCIGVLLEDRTLPPESRDRGRGRQAPQGPARSLGGVGDASDWVPRRRRRVGDE